MSQHFKITGSALFFAGEKVSISEYASTISESKSQISAQYIDEKGNFEFVLPIENAKTLFLKIELREIIIHAHPNTHISLDFTPFDYADNQQLVMPYIQEYIAKPANIAPDSLYAFIEDEFAEQQLRVSKTTSLLTIYNDFFKSSDSVYANYIQSDSLFADFYHYFKARAYLRTSKSKIQLANDYILQKPINYTSESYLTFFKLLMVPRVNSVFLKQAKKLEQAKKEFKVYDALLKVLETDTLLKITEARSLALLLFTQSSISNRFFDKNTNAAIIGQIANFCAYPDQKKAARNIQESRSKLVTGTESPLFSLANKKGDYVDLTEFRGSPVYLGFIHSESTTCQRDILILEKLRKTYRKVSFVMIIVDRDTSDKKMFPPSSGNLTYLYLNKNYDVLEDYAIWNFPVYYLLDDHGYLLQSTAKNPSSMFETFEVMFRRKSKRKRYEIINQN